MATTTPVRFAKCQRVITIPQYTGTCWFNAILMATLFSENMRNMLLNLRKTKSKETKLDGIIDDIINRRFRSTYVMRDYAYMFFRVVTPESILQHLHDIDSKTFMFNPKTMEGFRNDVYLPRFLHFLGVNKIVAFEVIKEKLFYSPLLTSDASWKSAKSMIRTYETGKSHEPPFHEADVVLVSYDVLPDDVKKRMKSKSAINKDPFRFSETFKWKGTDYVLDSLLLTNFNIDQCKLGHDVCGITCQGDRYIYNGWVRGTKDPAKKTSGSRLPCELMKFDWMHADHDFCINPSACSLDTVSDEKVRKTVCFNVFSGSRTYIFVNPKHAYRTVSTPTDSFVPEVGPQVKGEMIGSPSQKKTAPRTRVSSCNKQRYTLRNQNNSCYLDTFLVGLFHWEPSHFRQTLLGANVLKHIDEHGAMNQQLLETGGDIKRELYRIVENMSARENDVKVETCTTLRKMFARYARLYKQHMSPTSEVLDWKQEQLEPFDVFNFLNIVFDIPELVKIERVKLGTQSKAKKISRSALNTIDTRNEHQTYVETLSLEDLSTFADEADGSVKLQKIYPTCMRNLPIISSEYKRIFEMTTIQDAPALYVHVPRMALGTKNTTKVVPLQELRMQSGKTLVLRSIFVHHGSHMAGHYTCVYKCGDNFYEYDDLRSNVTKIGSFATMKEHRNSYILRNGTCFVYM